MLQLTLLLALSISMVTGDSLSHVNYYPGSKYSRVVISDPHDGDIRASGIANRKQGCYDYTTKKCDWRHDCKGKRDSRKCKAGLDTDSNSSKLALKIRNAIGEVTGHMPHLIVSRLHRSKLDPNRFRDEAAQFDEGAQAAYDLFHGYIQKAHDIVAKRGPALHFDIHGYTSHIVDNWIELGYNIQRSELNDSKLDPELSSIRALVARSDKSFDSLLRGKSSLGWMFQQAGYKSVPSPRYPRPALGREGKYFRGGYITRKWGSLNQGDIDCIQIEFPPWVRDRYSEYGPALGRIMGKFVQKNY